MQTATPEPTGARTVSAWRSTSLGLLLIALATAVFAAVSGFLPPPGFGGDFTQDWLSARDFLAGRSVYGDLPDALRRHCGREQLGECLRWNAHPPGAVLLVLPFAGLEHERAFYAWNLATFPLFVLAVWIAAAELGVRPVRAAALAAVVSVLGVTSYPLLQQVALGQFNALLAFLVTLGWVADRRGRWCLAGSAVGSAMTVKLFPGFLLVYFLSARRWRAAGMAVVVFLLVNGLAAGLFGIGAYRTYALEVIPAVSGDYATKWNNLSSPAFWRRAFDPAPSSRVIPVVSSPVIGRALAAVAQLTVVGCVVWTGWRARSASGRDRAFASAAVGMLLVSPIAWPHYLVVLVVPVALLVARFPRGAAGWALVCCLAVLWLPDTLLPRLVYGPQEAARMSVHCHQPLSSVGNLLAASVPHYALLGVFLLTLRLPTSPPSTGLAQVAQTRPASGPRQRRRG
jgi:hypothetical protein